MTHIPMTKYELFAFKYISFPEQWRFFSRKRAIMPFLEGKYLAARRRHFFQGRSEGASLFLSDCARVWYLFSSRAQTRPTSAPSFFSHVYAHPCVCRTAHAQSLTPLAGRLFSALSLALAMLEIYHEQKSERGPPGSDGLAPRRAAFFSRGRHSKTCYVRACRKYSRVMQFRVSGQ